MQKTLALAALAAALALPVFAADTYTIDPAHTFPSFEVTHNGYSIQRGRFDKSKGKATLDFAAKTGNIELIIDTASIDTGFAARDAHLKAEDFFNVEKFPTMTYKADKVIFDGDQIVGAEGNLTLLGVTKPLALKVTNFHCGPNPFNKKPMCGAEVAATLKRSDFGLAKLVPAVGDEVKLYAPIEAIKD